MRFGARRRSPPHYYSIVAPTLGKIESHAAKRLLQHYLPLTDMPIAPRKYRARHMHIIVNHGTVDGRNEGATRAKDQAGTRLKSGSCRQS